MIVGKRHLRAVVVLAATPFIMGLSCTIGPGESEAVTLGVPYVAQTNGFYCGAASVLMWRQFNGLGAASQDQIYSWMGGANGVDPQAITSATQYWAGTFDAVLDWGTPAPDYKPQFFARQIQSIHNRVPLIPIVEYGYHSGVVNGGTWSKDATGQYNIWQDVYFHDPSGVSNRYFTSAAWQSYSLSGGDLYYQVISNSATYGWQNALTTYADSVSDSDGHTGGGPDDQYGL